MSNLTEVNHRQFVLRSIGRCSGNGSFSLGLTSVSRQIDLGVRRIKDDCDMGVGYVLVNNTRAEWISFIHLPASKARELAGNPVAAAVTTWYLLERRGDQIAFVSDTDWEWPFLTGSIKDLANFKEMTDAIVQELISESILRDDGIEWADDQEPESVYIRKLTNVWMEH